MPADGLSRAKALREAFARTKGDREDSFNIVCAHAAHGSLSFSWGELDAFTNSVSFGPRGVVVNLGLNPLTLKLDPASGLFQGSVQLPNSTDQLRYKGALNSKRQIGGGFVIRPDAVGRVVLIGEQ